MPARNRYLRTLLMICTLAFAAPAFADDFECDGLCVFGPGDRFENLIVKANAIAVLVGSHVDANIFVQDGAILRVRGGFIGGNIQADGAARIHVSNSHIGGDFQVDNNTGAIDLRHSDVGGNVQLFSNDMPQRQIRIINNDVDGDVQADSNRSRRFVVSRNRIEGNLQGESNDRAPVGVNNVIQGETDGQFDGF